MFKKIVDVLKEVFWLKKSKRQSTRKVAAKTTKKTTKKSAKKPTKPLKVVKPAKPLKEKKAPEKAAPAPKVVKPKKSDLDPALKPMGEITHYFDRIKVAVLKINQGTVLIGDKLTVVTPKYKFVQKIWSMQIESQDVKVAKKGQLIGIKIDKAVAAGDIVYK